MSAPQIHGTRRSFSASKALERLGADLRDIKEADGLTWKDVGRVLGKSEDRASDYANGVSEMTVTSFLLGCREWNGRFGNGVMEMIGQKVTPIGDVEMSDSDKLCRILLLAHLISEGINDEETPGLIDDDELRAIGSKKLDDAIRALDALRGRLARLDEPETDRVRAIR